VRISRKAPLLAVGVVLACSTQSAAAAPPGNCVSNFASTLGQAGVAGEVISGGAHDPSLFPFGLTAVSQQAHATLGSCPFNPEDFLGP
jgi:hypothetical protein